MCLKLLLAQVLVRKVLGGIRKSGRKGPGYCFLPWELMKNGMT